MDTELNATLKFDMPLVAEVVVLLGSEVGSVNYTMAWKSLETKVKSVRNSPSLLGFYICDDCDNAGSFPPAKMAQLYVAIKYVVIASP